MVQQTQVDDRERQKYVNKLIALCWFNDPSRNARGGAVEALAPSALGKGGEGARMYFSSNGFFDKARSEYIYAHFCHQSIIKLLNLVNVIIHCWVDIKCFKIGNYLHVFKYFLQCDHCLLQYQVSSLSKNIL